MALSPAYAVDGGKIPASMLRMTLWASTSGASGIVTPSDLRVTALPTPGGAVNVAPGGALMANRFTGAAAAQSYAAANDATTQVTIPATGASGGRTDYLILRINDWHFDGSQEPADPLTSLYCSFARVSSITNLTYPFVALAQITIPPNTGAITSAMIKDLRQVANPREQTVIRPITAVASDTAMDLISALPSGEIFPGHGYDTIGPQVIDVPSWATKVQIQCVWLGVYYPGTNPFGRYWVEWGPSTGANTRQISTDTFRFDAPNTGASRAVWIAAAEQSVPSSLRGTSQTFVPKARYDSDSGHRGVKMDYMSGMVWTVRFLEVADDSNS